MTCHRPVFKAPRVLAKQKCARGNEKFRLALLLDLEKASYGDTNVQSKASLHSWSCFVVHVQQMCMLHTMNKLT